jgi:hypothetical protein
MDPYSSYTQATNFDSISTGSRSSVLLEQSPILPQQAPQQQLPSFSEVGSALFSGLDEILS